MADQQEPPALTQGLATPQSATPAPTESDDAEDLMLRWEDHHKSFFELAEDLCHQEQFIDVTISCGDHNFPAHKLILSVCSPYFKNLFLRNPCKHPIVVLKDVHFKYMKLLLIFMYRGEVAVPQEDLPGLLKVARSLQVRGLAEMCSPCPAVVSPRKRYLSEMMADSDLESRDEEFSIDEVRSKLHGQLEIQAVTGVPSPPLPAWLNERSKYLPASSNYDPELASAPRSSRSESGPSEDEPHFSSGTFKREVPDSWHSENGSEGRETEPRDLAIRPEGEVPGEYRALLKRERLASQEGLDPRAFEYEPVPLQVSSVRKGSKDGESFDRDIDSEKKGGGTGQPSSSSLLDAARAAGLEISPSSSDPMSSISALLAAAQATGGIPSPSSTGAPTATSTQTKDSTGTSKTPGGAAAAAAAGEAGPSQGLDLSNPAAAMANVNAQMQLYYYMQKLQTAGMGNPKERKECPICGKTLYDRSTWNRHMRIHTGEKPYPCHYCGRRFRTNYNKLGHEKKCPDRHARAILTPSTPESPSVVPSVVYR